MIADEKATKKKKFEEKEAKHVRRVNALLVLFIQYLFETRPTCRVIELKNLMNFDKIKPRSILEFKRQANEKLMTNISREVRSV